MQVTLVGIETNVLTNPRSVVQQLTFTVIKTSDCGSEAIGDDFISTFFRPQEMQRKN